MFFVLTISLVANYLLLGICAYYIMIDFNLVKNDFEVKLPDFVSVYEDIPDEAINIIMLVWIAIAWWYVLPSIRKQ